MLLGLGMKSLNSLDKCQKFLVNDANKTWGKWNVYCDKESGNMLLWSFEYLGLIYFMLCQCHNIDLKTIEKPHQSFV